MRGEVTAFYSAIAHWEVKIQGPHNTVVKVLRRKQFELVRHKPSQRN
jgi:hypothetical protein